MTNEEIKRKLDESDLRYNISFISGTGIRVRWGSFRPYGETVERYVEEVKKIFPNSEIRSCLKQLVPWSKDSYFEVICNFY